MEIRDLEEKDRLYSLGLEDTDRFSENIGGGMPKGSIVLVEGSHSSGKSIIAERMAYGFCTEGYSVGFLSSEKNMGEFIDQMDSLGYGRDMFSEKDGFEKYILNNKLIYTYSNMGTGGLTRESPRGNSRLGLLDQLINAQELWDNDIIIIDTFSSILRNDPSFEGLVKGDERQEALEIISFLRELISNGKTVILTVEQSNLDGEEIMPFRSISDVYLELKTSVVGNDTRREIKVHRYAGVGGEQVGQSIGFEVREGTGIVIQNRTVV